MYRSRLFLAIITAWLLVSNAQAKVVISSSAAQPNASFPFALGAYAWNIGEGQLFVGAKTVPPADNATQSLSVALFPATSFTGIAPQKVQIGTTANQPNPIFGSTIAQMTLIDSIPVVATDQDPTHLYSVRYYLSPTTVLNQSPDLGGKVCALRGQANGSFFTVATCPNAPLAQFGDAGSQLLYGMIHRDEIVIGNQKYIDLSFIITNTTDLPTLKTILGCGNPVQTVGPIVVAADAPGNAALVKGAIDAIYTGYTVTGAAAPNSQVCAVLVNGISAVANNNAITANVIVGGTGASLPVSINQLGVMYTSTKLTYLVVTSQVNGSAPATYALPVVTIGNNTGQLAKKNDVPVNTYSEGPYFVFQRRDFTQPAVAAGDLFSPTDADILRAQVGGNSTLPGPISQLFIEKDTVFAVVNANGANVPGGLFASEALFDELGRVEGFSNWRAVAGYNYPIYAAGIFARQALYWAIEPDSLNIIDRVTRTQWGANDFMAKMGLILQNSEGAQGLNDYQRQNPAFSQTVGQRISLVCATGFGRVLAAQSGADNAVNFFTPASGILTPYNNNNDVLGPVPPNTDALNLGGPLLTSMGALVTSTIVSDTISSWLVVGGNGGVAVLAIPGTGAGWPIGTLTSYFGGLPATLTWQKLGNFSNVRKVCADGSYLYILSDQGLWRMQLSAAVVAAGINAPSTQLAQQTVGSYSTYETLSDFIVSGPLGILASSAGLFRSGSGQSMQTATEINWIGLPLPEGVRSVTRLNPQSPTGNDNEWATTNQGGVVYALNALVATHQTRVYRYAITNNVLVGGVTDTTVQQIPDQFTQNVPSFYFSRGDYRNYGVTDGASFLMSRSRYNPSNMAPFLEVLSPDLRAGIQQLAKASTAVYTVNNETSHLMGPVLLRSATGSWMAGGSVPITND